MIEQINAAIFAIPHYELFPFDFPGYFAQFFALTIFDHEIGGVFFLPLVP